MNTDLRAKTPGTYVLGWLAPGLFALLVSATIRYHSLAPTVTMPRVVGNLLAMSTVILLLLLALGRRFAVTRTTGWLLLAFAASSTISILGSGDADISLLRLELYFAMVLLAFVVYLAYREAGDSSLQAYFLAIALVHLPFLFSAILWIKDSTPPFWQYGARIAQFSHVRQFGEVAFFAAASGAALGVVSRRLLIPSFLLAAAALFGIIMTGCRGALLSWVLFVVLLGCLSHARLRAVLIGFATLVCSAGLVWCLDHSGQFPSPNIFSRVAQLVQGVEEGGDNGRIRLWIGSIRQIAVHPWFGSGPEGYWLSGCCDRNVMQAHNFILQLLMEFGLVGCALLALLLARAIKRVGGLAAARSLLAASPGNRVLACLLVSYLAYSLIDQTTYHVLPLLHFALFAGLFAAGLARARGAATAVI